MLKQDQIIPRSSDLKLNKDCSCCSPVSNFTSCCGFKQQLKLLSKPSESFSSTAPPANHHLQQNFSTNLPVVKKRQFAEAFDQSFPVHSCKKRKFPSNFYPLNCSAKSNLTYNQRKKAAKNLVDHTTQLANISANINENNDKFTDSSEQLFDVFEKIQPLHLSKSLDKHQDCIPQKLTQTQRDHTQLSRVSKLSSPVCGNDSVSAPQQKKTKPFSFDLEIITDLENLSRKNSDTNNKRRHHNLPQLNDSLTEIDPKILKRLFSLEEKLCEEILNSPPPQIPRLYRRSQSEFCQAREVAEAQLFSTASKIPPSYKRYHSWTNGSGKTPCPTNEEDPQRISSASARFDFTSSKSLTLEFNSNANATPHKKLCSKPDLNFISQQTSHNIIGLSGLENNLPKISSTIRSCPKKLVKTNSNIEAVRRFSLTKPVDISTFNSQRISENSKEHPFDWFPGDKDIEDLARLKVDITKTLACTCREKPDRRSRQPLETTLVTGEGLRTPRHCNQCASRSFSKNRNKLCEKDSVYFYSSSENTIFNQKALKEVEEKLNIEQLRNFSVTKEKIPHYLAKLFAGRQNSSEKKLRNSIELTAEGRQLSKPASETFAEYINRSKNKQLFQSSFNNHNIGKEVFFRRDSGHNKNVETERGLKLVLEPTLLSPDSEKTSLAHRQKLSLPNFPPQNNLSSFCYVQKLSEMGCIHSVSQKKRIEPCRSSIYSDVRATIDQSPTIIEEYSPIVLRYRTPYFRAHAQVIMPPIRNKETWTVGWIQACNYMRFINQYGDLGYSSWEIPALKAKRVPAVSDSDGVSYPWYGNTTEIATIVGPTDSYTRMNLTMNDNFYPSVTWDIPVSEGTNAHLTEIVRDQSFITWLAAINETTKEIIVLKTVRWSFYLEIRIDPTRELGHRARVVAPSIQNQPSISNGPCEKHHVAAATKIRRRVTNNSNSNCLNHIPISALVRPSANNAQTLIWRPTNSEPIVVVPAKEEHLESNELVLFNGCSAMHGKEAIMKELSRQELIQLQQLTR